MSSVYVDVQVSKTLPESHLNKLGIRDRRLYDLIQKVDSRSLRIQEGLAERMLKGSTPLLLLATTFYMINQPVIAGLAFGGFVLGLGDYIAHRFILHPHPRFLAAINEYPVLQKLVKVAKEHVMDHQQLFPGIKTTNYVLTDSTKLSDLDIQNDLVPLMQRAQLTTEQMRDYVEVSKNGIYATVGVHLAGMLGLGGVSGLFGYLLPSEHSMLIGAVSGLVAATYTGYVNLFHPPLHKFESRTVEMENGLLKWYLMTSFFRATALRHYIHHIRSNSNFAVTLFGFDRIFGTHQTPRLKDILDMYEADLLF